MIPEIQAEKQNTKQNQLSRNVNITKTYMLNFVLSSKTNLKPLLSFSKS